MIQYDSNRKFYEPVIGTSESVGIDVFLPEAIHIRPRGFCSIPLNIVLNMPKGYYVEIKSKSSKAMCGVFVQGGIIDSDYRNEVSLILYNFSDNEVTYPSGEKICQFILGRVFIVSDSLTLRNGGFGSTGCRSKEC